MLLILPEITLTLIALLGQCFALMIPNKNKIIYNIVILLCIISIFLTFKYSSYEGIWHSFATGINIGISKSIVLLFTIVSLIIYRDYSNLIGEAIKFEFITLILLSIVGIFVAISSRNFLLLFCGMELTALTSYALAGFKLDDIQSSEGALKYFILGSLVTCLSLFGISFIYGFGGSIQFEDILHQLNNNSEIKPGLIIGIVLFLSSIFFKLASSPLHFWIPDVYEGSPISSITYFTSAAKIGMVIVLFNISKLIIGNYYPINYNLIKIIAILSMLFGAFGAIQQTSLKRLMAYSTILNIGYVLIGVILPNQEGYKAALLYILIYAVVSIGFFTCLIMLFGKDVDKASFKTIQGIAETHKTIAALISIVMFSMIGIPPLTGFFGKYYLFYQAINKQEFTLAYCGIFTSVVAAFYYLKVVKAMYFSKKNSIIKLPIQYGLLLINYLVLVFLLFGSFIILF
ncbi:NADH-quinone oxidoreductase subunit NuoN [Rickettsia typhi]|uniref:NADH-quinone oxidoreductase subunit N n=2 Tax=Rickettsia typhi TaxID=785 RepID=NUON_RICTY|nr:NADH-quinone oxidoreductase subunit NuoN [Rickettsia typhi]Q68WJ7.1 RecName: Full=NADH-quinone oxidoreductase subunit N; AltName: Full=NADH dehydrogenase I subunit N; AltName: Full=NDH-1 subunit N [Rickettsia typhi str. Wilmington]AAU03995.1 NADH dehydrogenase (ubiquinone) subunit N [Rickettsia typhi str. Wilmington]AFE54374.1 NADH:ubiquinone oxidoreductase subunit N [Rickettsia typhi str. TH1527]AFE55212.1 NADH:ubiquinone oxidoreductase subunit N [Rickettsia typhi str. B9991CWPP]